jgi:hypothetical protein
MSMSKFVYEVPFEKVDLKTYSIMIFASNKEDADKILDKYLDEGYEGEFPEFYVRTLETEVDRENVKLISSTNYNEEEDKDDYEVQKELIETIDNESYNETEETTDTENEKE